MGTSIRQKQYNELMSDGGRLFEHGREESRRSGNHAQTRAYREIGQRSRSEHGDNDRAVYCEGLLEKLSEDLTSKFGQGFSKRSLSNMVTLARNYKRKELNPNLNWSRSVLLFAVSDIDARRELEHRAIRDRMSYLRFKKAVRLEERQKPRTTPSGRNPAYVQNQR